MEGREKKLEYLLHFIAIGVIWLWLVFGVFTLQGFEVCNEY
jgi:hypothetical protein